MAVVCEKLHGFFLSRAARDAVDAHFAPPRAAAPGCTGRGLGSEGDVYGKR
jgi:hypothetical protein